MATTTETIWDRLLPAWEQHLHAADPANLDHLAADAEYLPPSPVANRMRADVAAERASRAGGTRRG